MRADIRRRLEKLEAGDTAQAERHGIIAREEAKRCEELGIPERTEGEKQAFRKAYDASKPANWDELSSMEQTGHFVVLSDDNPNA